MRNLMRMEAARTCNEAKYYVRLNGENVPSLPLTWNEALNKCKHLSKTPLWNPYKFAIAPCTSIEIIDFNNEVLYKYK